MQFGIKSLLGAMVLLAAFVMGVFQFSIEVCLWTLLIAHLLSPALWVAGSCASQGPRLKTFFLSGLSAGIAPWIATFWWYFMLTQQFGMRTSIDPDDREERIVFLAVWSSSGVIAIVGGLLGVWVQACCRPAHGSDERPSSVLPAAADPLAPEAK